MLRKTSFSGGHGLENPGAAVHGSHVSELSNLESKCMGVSEYSGALLNDDNPFQENRR